MSDDTSTDRAGGDDVTVDATEADDAPVDRTEADDAPVDRTEADDASVLSEVDAPTSAPGKAASSERAHLLSLAPWALLSAGWFVLTVSKLSRLVTPGALAGLLASLGMVAAGVVTVVRYGDVTAAKLLAGALFLIGGVSTILSANAGTAAWFPNDLVTTVADVTILAALLLVLSLKTERGQNAVA
jgi:hypothetical protein